MTEKNNWSDPVEMLEAIKLRTLKDMKEEEIWYTKFRKSHAVYSRLIRIFSLVLFAIGIIWPIISHISEVSTVKTDQPILTLDIGYISLAVGGLLLLLDRFLGVSSGYVRFYIAELDIQRNTRDFLEDWDLEMVRSNDPLTKENIQNFLNLVKKFTQSVESTVKSETDVWAGEFKTQTNELYELFKQKEESYKKPGNISVVLSNQEHYQDIEISLDANASISLKEGSTHIYTDVPPGPHKILVKAKKQADPVSFSVNVIVEPDKTVEKVIPFPVV